MRRLISIETENEDRNKAVDKPEEINDIDLDNNANVVQRQETWDLKSLQCGFESHHSHHSFKNSVYEVVYSISRLVRNNHCCC